MEAMEATEHMACQKATMLNPENKNLNAEN